MNMKGFTLAEVLVTIGIIGVVAVMTIPSLLHKLDNIVTVNKVKETYSMIAQAHQLVEKELDCTGFDAATCIENFTQTSNTTRTNEYVDELKKHLKYQYTACRQEMKNANWIPQSVKRMNGTVSKYQGISKTWTSHGCAFKLSNGVNIIVEVEPQEINIWMDINGAKLPNQTGVDVFPMAIDAHNNTYYKGVNPYYGENGEVNDDGGLCATRNGKICSPDDGHSPTAYILKHNKVFDIKKLQF